MGWPGVGLGLLTPEISLLNFYPPHVGETSWFHVCTSPTGLDGCGFFSSVVVRLPLDSISDGSER